MSRSINPQNKGILSKVFCISGPNLAISAWKGDELSRGRAHDWISHTQTHTQAQARTTPGDQNWPLVKSHGNHPRLTSRARFQKWSAQIRSCDPDRPIAFHKRWSRSAHQTEKIRNQTVYCQLNHDINHSLGVLELKLRGRDWMKNARLMVSIHDVTMGGVVTSFMSADTRALCPVQCTHTIQHGLDMPYLAGKCMWLTLLKLSKLLTQDRPCSI